MKLSSIILWGYENLRAILMGYKTTLLEKNLDEVINRWWEEKLTDI